MIYIQHYTFDSFLKLNIYQADEWRMPMAEVWTKDCQGKPMPQIILSLHNVTSLSSSQTGLNLTFEINRKKCVYLSFNNIHACGVWHNYAFYHHVCVYVIIGVWFSMSFIVVIGNYMYPNSLMISNATCEPIQIEFW